MPRVSTSCAARRGQRCPKPSVSPWMSPISPKSGGAEALFRPGFSILARWRLPRIRPLQTSAAPSRIRAKAAGPSMRRSKRRCLPTFSPRRCSHGFVRARSTRSATSFCRQCGSNSAAMSNIQPHILLANNPAFPMRMCCEAPVMATLIIVASFISGLVCGHFTISVCESFFHRTIQHAGPRLRHWYEQAGWVGQALLDAWYSHHVVHHFLTFRANHVTQFGSDEERSRLNWRLKTHRINDIIECRYGEILGSQPRTYIEYTAPTLPIFVSLCCLGGGWFTMGACIPFCIWPLLAQFVHPYLHMRYDAVMQRGPIVIRVLARTAYFKYLARHHWLHHRYTNCNYNLLLGGDYVLGVHRSAAAQDIDGVT